MESSGLGAPTSPPPKTFMEKVKDFLWDDLLLYLTILAVVLGGAVGFFVRSFKPDWYTIYLMKFPGEIMLRMLKMLILPLVTCSLITGITELDSGASGKMGSKALIYCFSTTIFSVTLGIIMGLIIHPGDPKVEKKTDDYAKEDAPKGNSVDAMMDLIRNMFPDNLVQACFQQAKTSFREIPNPNGSNTTVSVQDGVEYSNGMNVLGLITFCILFGITMTKMRETAEPMINLIAACNEMIMSLVLFFMWYAPVGIFFLIVSSICNIDNLQDIAKILGWYIATVLSGLLIHLGITLTGLYILFTRKNPFTFVRNMLFAMLTAFGTASSAATLPMTFHCLEEKNKLDPRVTRLVIPIGAFVNMDGTALYEAVTAIFIAQLNNVPLHIGTIISIWVASILASVGTASIPSSGLVMLVLVFTAVGLPTDQISLIITIDWFLDRCRTTVNVMGDSFGAAILDSDWRKQNREINEVPSVTEEAVNEIEMAERQPDKEENP